MFKLIIEDDEGHTTVVPLLQDEITIGRKEDNTIRLTERNVSRYHARLVRTNGSFYIEDLDSYNGVKVNGDRITSRTTISEGDLVEIGDYHLALQWVDDGKEATKDQARPVPPPLGQQQAMQTDGATAILKLPVEKREDDKARPVEQIPPEKVARFQVLSTELEGRVFELNKTELTIGRTDENDIVLPHRSVSSKHAKLVFDGEIYRILDLDSANGVLVNGEEYARVDLRPGDVVELGHVKLKFLPPGTPPERVTRPERPQAIQKRPEPMMVKPVGRSKWWLWASIAAVVAVSAVGLVYFTGKKESDSLRSEAEKTAPETPEAHTTAATRQASLDKQRAASWFKDAAEKFKLGDFEAAREILNKLSELQPDYPGVESMLEKIDKAEADGKKMKKIRVAMDNRRWDEAWDLLAGVEENGYFEREVKELRKLLKPKLIVYHLNKAKKAMSSPKTMAQARSHLARAREIDPENASVKRLLSEVQRMERAPKLASVSGKRPVKRTGKRKPVDGWKKAGVTKAMFTKLFQARKYGEALKVLTRVLKENPRDCFARYFYIYTSSMLGMGADEQIRRYKKFIRECMGHKLVPRARDNIKFIEARKREMGIE